MDNNDLDFELAKSVAGYFKLNSGKADEILNEVESCVVNWPKIARLIGISQQEQELMSGAFRV
jgi:serine/threonine-protein kinase HipA